MKKPNIIGKGDKRPNGGTETMASREGTGIYIGAEGTGYADDIRP